MFENTQNQWYTCNGSGWVLVGSGSGDEFFSAFTPGSLSDSTPLTGKYKTKNPHGKVEMTYHARTAGVGAGDVTITLYDETSNTPMCAVTVPCTATTKHSGCVVATSGNAIHRVNTNTACTTQPSEVMVNVRME
jgi:hypothetical protein